MFEGRLAAIHVSDSGAGPMQDIDQAEAVPGRGLDADRYAHQKGSFQKTKPQDPSREITLIERAATVRAERTCPRPLPTTPRPFCSLKYPRLADGLAVTPPIWARYVVRDQQRRRQEVGERPHR